MKTRRSSQLASLAIAAAVSVGLAGCGGSNDNNEEAVVTQPSPPPAKTAMTADIALSDAQSAALKAELDENGDSVDLKDGDKRVGITFACTSSDPCTIKVENSAGTIVATAHSTTSGTVSGTATGVDEPEVSGAGATALRTDLLTSGRDASGADNTAVTGFADNAAQLTVAGFPSASSELKDPKDGDTKFTGSDDAPPALQGWKGERWTKDGETIVRYTDQNVKTMTDGTFASQFGNNEAGGGDVITNTATTGQIDWKLAEADDFPTASKTQSYVAGDGETGNPPPASLVGKFAGVDGKFTCEASCTLSRNSEGVMTATAGSWTFTADDEKSAVEYKVQDEDYLAFGWWRESSTGGTAIEDFRVLYDGRDAHAGSSLSGKATYNGHAAGNYVKGSTGGEFVAEAKLTATFAGGTDGNVKGTISKFQDSSGDSLGTWEVIANTGGYDSSAGDTAINFAPTLTGSADGKAWTSGEGNGVFYGPDDNGALPSGVAGWFHATTNSSISTTNPWVANDVVVAGAFAATRHTRAGE